jgi:signal transduction histidine kinase
VSKQISDTVEPVDPTVPTQRGQDRGRPGPHGSHTVTRTGGRALIADSFVQPYPIVAHRPAPVEPPATAEPRRWSVLAALTGGSPRRRGLIFDVLAVLISALDVALVIPPDGPVYSLVLSVISCAALVLRRPMPFVAALLTIPGFLAGWSELAPMIALGTLAWRYGRGWQTLTVAAGVWFCRFFVWPVSEFNAEPWTEHIHDGVYACIVVAMPVAIGLLITARHDLSARIVELAASRERERRLEAANVRADERAKIARDMHDGVSHQVSLIAMHAGALQVTTTDRSARDAAATIRLLSRRTLDELRELVGAWRADAEQDVGKDALDGLLELVRDSAMEVDLSLDLHGTRLPTPVAGAAYRTVQEALTNVRKYAAEAPATVRVAVEDDELVVEVRNEAPAGGQDHPSGRPLPSGGHGLVGLRERADLLGGRFEAARTEPGGFLVRASFPLPTQN